MPLRLILAISILFAACSSRPALPSYEIVPDFQLTDQTGSRFSSKDKLDGKVWIANFIFTTCQGPCPRMTSQMGQIQRALPTSSDIRLVSFTIDPDHDTPEALASYGQRFKADPNRWWFLTGTKQDLNRLSYDAFHLSTIGGPLEHSTRFVLVDQKGRVRGYYDSSEQESMNKLVADAKDLAGEGG